MARYLLDTSPLLRAAHRDAATHDLAVSAIAWLRAHGDDLLVTPQVLIEFWCVATRPTDVNGLGWPQSRVADEVQDVLDRFPLVDDTPDVFRHWLELVKTHGVRGKHTHDARLIAVMQAHGITHVLTFNVGDFKGFPIQAVSPADIVAKSSAGA